MWDNRVLAMKKLAKTQRLATVEKLPDGEIKLLSTTSMPITTYDSHGLAFTKSNDKVAQLFTIPDGNDKKQYLRVRFQPIISFLAYQDRGFRRSFLKTRNRKCILTFEKALKS